MKVIEANEGRKIPYSENGTWLSFDDQIMINLKTQEADKDVHIDITSGEGLYYVAQIDIPARQYIEEEVENPDYNPDDETSAKTITKREAVPFSMENVTLTLYALKEGVFNE